MARSLFYGRLRAGGRYTAHVGSFLKYEMEETRNKPWTVVNQETWIAVGRQKNDHKFCKSSARILPGKFFRGSSYLSAEFLRFSRLL